MPEQQGLLEDTQQLQPSGEIQQQPQLSEADQKDANNYIVHAIKSIHSEAREDILKGLSMGEPIESLADMTVNVLSRLDTSARENGREPSDSVKTAVATVIMGELNNLAKVAGVFDLSPEEQQASFSVAVQKYIDGEAEAGRIDKNKLATEATQSISRMPPEAREEIDTQLKNINQTVMRSRGVVQDGA
jgi:BMFP domain-containing protein YqiC